MKEFCGNAQFGKKITCNQLQQQNGLFSRKKKRNNKEVFFSMTKYVFFLFQIDLDVNRTYRDHRDFRKRYNQTQKSLFYVLAAYSVYNTEVGYCQGKII